MKQSAINAQDVDRKKVEIAIENKCIITTIISTEFYFQFTLTLSVLSAWPTSCMTWHLLYGYVLYDLTLPAWILPVWSATYCMFTTCLTWHFMTYFLFNLILTACFLPVYSPAGSVALRRLNYDTTRLTFLSLWTELPTSQSLPPWIQRCLLPDLNNS